MHVIEPGSPAHTWGRSASAQRDMLKRRRRLFALLLIPLYAGCSATYLSLSGKVSSSGDWYTASREPAGLAPDPATTREAVVQVYSARALRWRGYFGVHTWIAVKPTGADHFTVPYAKTYRVWPGPNSNTFTAFVPRAAPELRVDLPPTAIGKDYLGIVPVAFTPSGTGAQVNVFGLAGVAAGWEEGVEVNVLGLTFGIDPKHLSLKLPIIGRIGPDS